MQQQDINQEGTYDNTIINLSVSVLPSSAEEGMAPIATPPIHIVPAVQPTVAPATVVPAPAIVATVPAVHSAAPAVPQAPQQSLSRQPQHQYGTRRATASNNIEVMYNDIINNILYSYKLSIRKSLNGKYAMESENAIYDEFMNMKSNNVLLPVWWRDLTAVELSHVIPAHMFLKEKYKADGEFDKIKGRIVAGGDKQDESTYDNIASPTINSIVILALINIFTILNLFVIALDIKHAFLKVPTNPTEKHPVIMLRPDLVQLWTKYFPADKVYVHSNGCMCFKLGAYTYIYGLKQSPRMFYQHIKNILINMGFI
jgi:hypothetical protein